MHARRQLVGYDQSGDLDRRQGRQLAQQHGSTLPKAKLAAATCMVSSRNIFRYLSQPSWLVQKVAFDTYFEESIQTQDTTY